MVTRHLSSSSSLARQSNFAAVRLEVEYVATDRLKTRSRQVRRRSKQHDKRIARSIADFGFVVPIVVDEHLTIVAGEGRWEGAKLLDMTEVPVIKLEHLTEEQLRLFTIADNKLPEGARWDGGELLLELTEIELAAPDLDLTSSGLAIAEIDSIYGRERTNELSDFDDPVEPDRERVPVSRVGDIWILGRHILGCGDALDTAFIARLLKGRQVRLLLSDPPWNLEIPGVVSGNGKHKHGNFVMASGEMSKGEFTVFLTDAIRATEPHLVDGALVYLFMDWRNLDALSAAAPSHPRRQARAGQRHCPSRCGHRLAMHPPK